MTERDEGQQADAAKQGDYFFGVCDPDGKITLLYADKVVIEHGGVLCCYRKRGDELQITLAWPPGRWEGFWEASSTCGDAIAVDSIVKQKRDIPESLAIDLIQGEGGTLSANDFSGTVGIDYETTLQWLKEGLVPGARKVSGSRWAVPAALVPLLQTLREYVEDGIKRIGYRTRGRN
jgi:hypothetical protein